MDEYRKDFYKIYNSTIIPILKKYEVERKEKLKKLRIYWGALGILCLITGYYAFNLNGITQSEFQQNINFILFFILISVIIAISVIFNFKFVEKLKKECIPHILKLFGNVKWHNEVNTISNADLRDSDLFAEFNRRSTEDSFSGSYNGVKFKIAETLLGYKDESDSEKEKHEVTIFKGVVIKFDANKQINNKTIIITRGDDKFKNSDLVYILPFMIFVITGTLWIQACLELPYDITILFPYFLCGLILFYFIKFIFSLGDKNTGKLNELKLEDPEFSKKYKAYSSDQVEGRYLITPAFMERFKNIQTAFGSRMVKCSFYNDSLMFAISTNKNLFEIGNLFCSLENPRHFETFFNELTSIFMLVDYFKLDEKTGL